MNRKEFIEILKNSTVEIEIDSYCEYENTIDDGYLINIIENDVFIAKYYLAYTVTKNNDELLVETDTIADYFHIYGNDGNVFDVDDVEREKDIEWLVFTYTKLGDFGDVNKLF